MGAKDLEDFDERTTLAQCTIKTLEKKIDTLTKAKDPQLLRNPIPTVLGAKAPPSGAAPAPKIKGVPKLSGNF